MKKTKLNLDQKKLRMNKEIITAMTPEKLGAIQGGASGPLFCSATYDMSKCPQCYDTYTCDTSLTSC